MTDLAVFQALLLAFLAAGPSGARRPTSDADLRDRLEVMIVDHRYRTEEITAATGLSATEIEAAVKRLKIDENGRRRPVDALHVVPYPGGRHPRIGFLDGAVDPQRETKISVFTPWDKYDYVVVDVPEAIWSNLGLTYLAHTHVPTLWTKTGVALAPMEWSRRPDGRLEIERVLPNGIAFGAHIVPRKDMVRMELHLRNGTDRPLSGLKVQNCVMLKGAKGFQEQTNKNKLMKAPYIACRSTDGNRWVVTAWEPSDRVWGNSRCPCMHSDPKFADCPPQSTVRVRGGLWFYEGADIDAELKRIDATDWREPKT